MKHSPLLHTVLLCFCLFFISISSAQTSRIDSIKGRLALDSLSGEAVNQFTRQGFEYLLVDTDSSLAFLSVALDGAQELQDPSLINNAAYWMARAFMIRGEETESFLYGHMSLTFSEQAGDSVRIARSYSFLGIAYKYVKDFTKAMEYHNKALDFYRMRQDFKKMGTELNNLGLIFEEQGDLDGAERVYTEALSLKVQAKDRRGQAYVKGNLASVAFEKGNIDRAATLCDELIAETDHPRLRDIQGEALSLRADIAMQRKQFAYAQTILERASTLLEGLNAPSLELKILRSQYELQKQNGKIDEALATLEKHMVLADSLAEAENLELMASLTLQRERKENAILEKKVELARARTESAAVRERWTQIGAFSLLFGALVVILLILKNQRREHRARLKIETQAQQLRELNREIQDKSVQLGNHSRVKDKILSLIAHDLRSPIASLGELLDMLHEGRLPEEQFRQLTRTLRARMAGIGPMLVNLLEWASYQIKSYEPQKQQVDLTEIATTSLNLFENVARAKQINLSLEIPASLMAYVDPGMIHLALRNLLSNALKFTEIGGSVKVEGHYSGHRTVISVSDTGVGMTPEQQGRLFSEEHFTTPGTEEERGAGLGLLLVRDFVSQNEGELKVKSEEGKGSTFLLDLPTAV